MDTSHADGGWRADHLTVLTRDLCAIRDHVLAFERSSKSTTGPIETEHKSSARNLLHYLALRQRDLRPLQKKLARFGLSSLGRSESHVLANLEAVIKVLHHLTGREYQLSENDFLAGRLALERNTAVLLGPRPRDRDVRIMVTMPSEAAGDYWLVRDLVAAGMDCMRINCAHDDEPAWAAMIENLRRAKAELRRDCRILMDLPGPKLRTGPIETLPGVVKWQPRRNRYGRVLGPARIWLAAEASGPAGPAGAHARLAMPREWLAKLKLNDTIKFLDARGLSRSIEVKAIAQEGCWAEGLKTAYVADGTMLQIMRAENGAALSAAAACVKDLPPEPQPLHLKTGDVLLLTREARPGRPAAYDAEGKVVRPAAVAVSLPEIFSDVRAGESIWFDDGKIGGAIRSVDADAIAVEITKARPKGEKLWADKGINLPDSSLTLPALTAEDLALLPFLVAHADLVGYSFVRSAADIAELQDHLTRLGGGGLGIVLKIETRQAFEELPHLLLAAMRGHAAGVMIARGDLAVECGYERTGELQEEIMWLAEAAHVPVIWATQVLENVAKTGQASRAEITDAAMAERAECVMLNKGPYVVQAVQMLDDVLKRMERHQIKKVSLLRPLKLAERFSTGRSAGGADPASGGESSSTIVGAEADSPPPAARSA
jgi:pyruvate kinase